MCVYVCVSSSTFWIKNAYKAISFTSFFWFCLFWVNCIMFIYVYVCVDTCICLYMFIAFTFYLSDVDTITESVD